MFIIMIACYYLQYVTRVSWKNTELFMISEFLRILISYS